MPLRRLNGDAIPTMAAPPPSPLHVTMLVPQEKTVWCWAACVEMVCTADDKVCLQCRSAAWVFRKPCCQDLTGCIAPIPPSQVLELWHSSDVGYTDVVFDDRLALDALLADLDQEGPVQVWLGERTEDEKEQIGGSGHVVLVTDHQLDGKGMLVLSVLDPNEKGVKEVSYDGLVNNALGHGPWVGTWRKILKTNEDASNAL